MTPGAEKQPSSLVFEGTGDDKLNDSQITVRRSIDGTLSMTVLTRHGHQQAFLTEREASRIGLALLQLAQSAPSKSGQPDD